MTLLDVIIWIILAAFTVKGFLKGLIRELCTVFGLIAGGWAAFRYYSSASSAFAPFITLPHNVSVSLAFIFIFLTVGLLFYLLGHLLTVMLKIMLLGGVNRFGGMLFGLLEGAFILCMLLHLANTKPAPEKFKSYLMTSPTAKKFSESGSIIVSGWESARKQPASPKSH